MTTDGANTLNTTKRRCFKCHKYKDAPLEWLAGVSWVCADCSETLAEGMPEDDGPVAGDPD